mmetsp:Transcript_22145/g.28880  ORF Transcript_22145/g.28880 Transcript_22145/m.28880 type:complete len:122 (-) Transcript_22145:38-403(-)
MEPFCAICGRAWNPFINNDKTKKKESLTPPPQQRTTLEQRIPSGYKLINLHQTDRIEGKELKCFKIVPIKPLPQPTFDSFEDYKQHEKDITNYALNHIYEIYTSETVLSGGMVIKASSERF